MKSIKQRTWIVLFFVILLGGACSRWHGTLLKKRYSKGYQWLGARDIYRAKHLNQRHLFPAEISDEVIKDREERILADGTSGISCRSLSETFVVPSNKNHFCKKTLQKPENDKILLEEKRGQRLIQNHKSYTYQKIPFHQKEHQNLNTRKKDSDTELIVLVILSLFPIICLIAIYLKDGKEITTNFWVDLILHFLFFIPAVIFAILVVLDLVNLNK